MRKIEMQNSRNCNMLFKNANFSKKRYRLMNGFCRVITLYLISNYHETVSGVVVCSLLYLEGMERQIIQIVCKNQEIYLTYLFSFITVVTEQQ